MIRFFRVSALEIGLAALIGALIALVSLTTPAHATEQGETVCGTWQLRGATGQYPAITFGGAPAGASVESASSVKLVKPTEGVMPGVEFAAYDLDVSVVNETTVSVGYQLGDGAASSAGAIRLFGYSEQDADTINDAPDYGPAIAGGESGTLVFTLPAGSDLGTLGLVYDASNSAAGYVRFTELEVGNRPVSFTTCPTPEPTATATPGPTATATPTAGPTAQPSSSASAPPVASPGLPVTGTRTMVLVGAGVALLLGGVLVYFGLRRRRVDFAA